jgi:D-methionine transport system substrate-binding protein
MKRLLAVVCVVVLGFGLLAGCNRGNDELVRIVIGATPRPHAEILEYITPALREAGIELVIEEFTDFFVPNVALFDGQIMANYFQHTPFLNAYMTNSGNTLHIVGPVHVEPMGAYSMTLDNIMDIPEGGLVAIPHDATNGGRALMLLEQVGLIGLDPAAGILATPNDIIFNPRNLRFIELEAAMLPRALLGNDADLSIVNTNHLIAGTNLCPVNDSLAREAVIGNPYANILVVRPEDANNEYIAILYRHLTSEAVRAFIYRTYTGIEPVF